MTSAIFAIRSYFYPRPPGGGRRDEHGRYKLSTAISIHALRVEGDSASGAVCLFSGISIHALRVEGDRCLVGWRLLRSISIHALRVEGDSMPFSLKLASFNFYPRPPGGGRPNLLRSLTRCLRFLSTPSGWRATNTAFDIILSYLFLSTPSGWRATTWNNTSMTLHGFLSTPSGWRATPALPFHVSKDGNFYPRPPGGGRPTVV